MIAGITRDITETFNVDTSRIYVAGLSAGGAMAVIMGTAYPEIYAAVGVHSGLAYASASDIYSALNAMRSGTSFVLKHDGRAVEIENVRQMPTIVFHGDKDTTVHPSNSDNVMEQGAFLAVDNSSLEKNNIVVEHVDSEVGHAYTRSIYMNSSGDPVAEQWLVHGAGHAWSGGSPLGSFTDPKGPDATNEMLRFFLSQSQASCKPVALDMTCA